LVACREEVRDLAVWCQDNISLNVNKTKEMIVDYRKRRTELRAVVKQVESFKSLVVHINNKLTWSSTPRQS
jgi:phosphopantetheine adenylyltransferase